MRPFWNAIVNQETGENELRIDGPITMEQGLGDWLFDKPDRSATAIEKAIKAMRGDITVWINSPGGMTVAASVIYTALLNHSGKVTVKIDGMAISAASVIAMAGDEILMSPTSVMMIHNPLTVAQGEVKDMQKAIDILTEVKESILNAYERKTGKSRQELAGMMDEEKWMSASTAIEFGFADGMLFEDEVQDEGVTNGIIKGARMVYNSIGKEDIALKLKQFLDEQENNTPKDQPKNEADFLLYQNKLALERVRF